MYTKIKGITQRTQPRVPEVLLFHSLSIWYRQRSPCNVHSINWAIWICINDNLSERLGVLPKDTFYHAPFFNIIYWLGRNLWSFLSFWIFDLSPDILWRICGFESGQGSMIFIHYIISSHFLPYRVELGDIIHQSLNLLFLETRASIMFYWKYQHVNA